MPSESRLVRAMSSDSIPRMPSLHTGLPPQWNNSLQQCGAAILLFALATVLTQQAALGVVLLGIVRSFALLVFVAGGVMWPLAKIRAAQQARRDAKADAKASPSPVSKSATIRASRLSQALPTPSSAGAAPIRQSHHAQEPSTEAEAWPTNRSRLARDEVPPAGCDADVEREAQEGSAERASAILSHLLRSGNRPAASAFHAVVRAHAAAGRPVQASAWLERMLAEGLRPDAHVFNAALSAHAATSDAAGARVLLGRMAQLQWPALRWVQGHWASHLDDLDCC